MPCKQIYCELSFWKRRAVCISDSHCSWLGSNFGCVNPEACVAIAKRRSLNKAFHKWCKAWQDLSMASFNFTATFLPTWKIKSWLTSMAKNAMLFAAQTCPCDSHCVLCPKWRWEGLPTMHNIILWIETVAEFRMASSVPPETTPAAGGLKEISRIIMSHPCQWNNQSRLNDQKSECDAMDGLRLSWTKKMNQNLISTLIPVTISQLLLQKGERFPIGWEGGVITSRFWVLSFLCEGQSKFMAAWHSLAKLGSSLLVSRSHFVGSVVWGTFRLLAESLPSQHPALRIRKTKSKN